MSSAAEEALFVEEIDQLLALAGEQPTPQPRPRAAAAAAAASRKHAQPQLQWRGRSAAVAQPVLTSASLLPRLCSAL